MLFRYITKLSSHFFTYLWNAVVQRNTEFEMQTSMDHQTLQIILHWRQYCHYSLETIQLFNNQSQDYIIFSDTKRDQLSATSLK